MNSMFAIASILATAVFLLHTFLGGRTIAKPLLETPGLHPVPKLTSYYCWHIVTITLAVLSGMFAYAAVFEGGKDIGWTATLLTIGYCGLGLAVPVLNKQKFSHMPQGWLFLPIAILGLAGGSL